MKQDPLFQQEENSKVNHLHRVSTGEMSVINLMGGQLHR